MNERDIKTLTTHLGHMVDGEIEEMMFATRMGMAAATTRQEAQEVLVAAVREDNDEFLEVLFAYLENADEAVGTTDDGRTLYGSLCRDERERLTGFEADVYVGLLEKATA